MFRKLGHPIHQLFDGGFLIMVELFGRLHRHGIGTGGFGEHDVQGLKGAKIPFPFRKHRFLMKELCLDLSLAIVDR